MEVVVTLPRLKRRHLQINEAGLHASSDEYSFVEALLETLRSWEPDWAMRYIRKGVCGWREAEDLLRRGELVEIVGRRVNGMF